MVGIPLSFAAFLLYVVTGTIRPDAIPFLVGIALFVAAAAFALGYIEVFGGADSIAIIIIVLTLFYLPISNSLFVIAFVNNTTVVCLLIFMAIFVKNVVERNYRDLSLRQFPLMFIGTKISFSHFTTYHGIVLEEFGEENGVLTRRFMDASRNIRMERDRFTTAIAASDQADMYRQTEKVWVMYILPFIIPITAGLAVTLVTGDVVQILLRL